MFSASSENQRGVVRRHGVTTNEIHRAMGEQVIDPVQIPQSPARVALPQGGVKGRIAGTGVTAVVAKGSIDDQQAILWKAVAGFLQQRFRAGGWADVQQVDAQPWPSNPPQQRLGGAKGAARHPDPGHQASRQPVRRGGSRR